MDQGIGLRIHRFCVPNQQSVLLSFVRAGCPKVVAEELYVYMKLNDMVFLCICLITFQMDQEIAHWPCDL